MKFCRKVASLLCATTLILSLCACGASKQSATPKQDTTPLTMYVGLGLTNSGYYANLHDAILEETGIDVKYVYSNTLDTSTAILTRIANYDLPADIVITAASTPNELQKNAFLDLAANTNIPDLFSVSKMQQRTVDGGIYQIPFATRLIGVEYNRTLMDEMGWELPHNYSEMLELKAKADEAGVLFAVAANVATGHGFNYFMNLCGSEFLSSPDGTEWLDNFLAGKASVDEFAQQAAYFKDYAEAGLFGNIHNSDWNASTEFSHRRALFFYENVNNINAYDGFQYDENGRISGAEYSKDRQVIAVPDAEGEAVFYNGEYVLYDAANKEHEGLERYSIPGAVILHDEYGSMPWLSCDGGSNCFTAYDCLLMALDKKLGEPQEKEKLEEAVKVLEFMTSERAVNLFSDMFSDGIVFTNNYKADDTRLYRDCNDSVERGYTMPWYYNRFDTNTIVNVGQKINDFLIGGNGVTFTDIINELAERNDEFLRNEEEIACTFSETLSYEDSAKLQAIANGKDLQNAFKAAGIDGEVTVSVLPYIDNLQQLPVSVRIGVVQQRVYAGDLITANIKSIVSSNTNKPLAVCMTGGEIKALVSGGFNIMADFGVDSTFKYAWVVRGGIELEDSAEYIVALPEQCVEKSAFERLYADGKVMEGVSGNTETGLTEYFAEHKTLSPSDLVW